MDKGTKLAVLDLPEALRESMKSASEKKFSYLRIQDAPGKARIPSNLAAHECRSDSSLSERTGVENKPPHRVDTGIQVLRNNLAR
jgi:hypothetical protein